MFLCVAEHVGESITFHVLTPVILDESTCSSVEMEDESSTHNISMDPTPSVHPEVSLWVPYFCAKLSSLDLFVLFWMYLLFTFIFVVGPYFVFKYRS